MGGCQYALIAAFTGPPYEGSIEKGPTIEIDGGSWIVEALHYGSSGDPNNDKRIDPPE